MACFRAVTVLLLKALFRCSGTVIKYVPKDIGVLVKNRSLVKVRKISKGTCVDRYKVLSVPMRTTSMVSLKMAARLTVEME
jgi:hypothetical protein